MMAVDIETEPDFVAGVPRVLFSGWRYGRATPIRSYDVAPDGRFITRGSVEPIPPEPRTHVHVVSNWFDDLQRLVPSP